MSDNREPTLAVRCGKLNLIRRLVKPPRASLRDLWLTLLVALLWGLLVHARPWVIHTRCANHPSVCAADTVPKLDHYALDHDSPMADGLSYDTQNFSGVWAYAIPIGLQIGRVALQSQPLGLALSLIAQDSLILTETIVLNGALNESARLLVQRPRPFVYHDVGYYGSDPQNYTSFYSGHTSFAAATNGALIFTLLGRTRSLTLLAVVAVLGPLLILLTGLFRILSGRHFLTDVLTGAAAGILVSLAVALAHRASHRASAEKEHA